MMYRKNLAKGLGIAAVVLGLTAVQPAMIASAEVEISVEDNSMQTSALTETEKTPEDDSQDQAEALKISIKKYKHSFKTKQGKIYKKISYEYPVADGDSPAANTFNNFYQKQLKKWIKNAKKNLDSAKEVVKSVESEVGAYYTDNVTCEFVQNETYISVLQLGDDYTLGAHGMPYRISDFFKADTGENVSVANILGITKKELNNKVTELFLKKYNKKKGSDRAPFYNTDFVSAKEMKKNLQKMDFSDSCYLKNGKLCFYADPYALGPYAAGFIEVTMKL